MDIEAITRYVKRMYSENDQRKFRVKSTLPERQSVIDGNRTKKISLAYPDNNTFTRTKDGKTEKNVPK